MNRTYLFLLISIMAVGCEKQSNDEKFLPALSVDDRPLVSMTLFGPVCANVPEPDCLREWNEQSAEYDECYSNCELVGPCDESDVECALCIQQCDFINPGPVDCPTISVEAECTDCADNLYDSVKNCTIPDFLNPPGTFDIVTPCDQDFWEAVGECSVCRAQPVSQPMSLGRSDCTCPVPGGTSWSNICFTPYDVPKLSLGLE